MSPSHEQFICEPLTPAAGSADAPAMATGAPGLPQRFTWRDTEYRLTGVLKAWKSSGPCHNGSKERYLRRHWYTIVTEPPLVMTIYCDRQARDRKHPKARWWVYTIEDAAQLK